MNDLGSTMSKGPSQPPWRQAASTASGSCLFTAVIAAASLLTVGKYPFFGWTVFPAHGPRYLESRRALGSLRDSAKSSTWTKVGRRAKIDGDFGVLPETASPTIDLSDEDDPVYEGLVAVVQAADQKRAVDIKAFWINEGWELIVIASALSRPQLAAIAAEIEIRMRKELRIKRFKIPSYHVRQPDLSVREQAAAGWVCLSYPRLTVHVMTPLQRNYYNIEGMWRDEKEDYQEIPLEVILRDDTFGTLRLKSDAVGSDDNDENSQPPGIGGSDTQDYYDDNYEKDEEDPFWS